MCSVKIERAVNGYEVCLTDPKIAAENAKPNGKWRDPEREFVFDDIEGVLDFLEKNLDKALPMDDYESSFDMAANEEADD